MRPRLGAILFFTLACAGALAISWPIRDEHPESLRETVERFMAREHIAGAVVAFGRAGAAPQLLALGHADPDGDEPMRPGLRFRIASLSKPVTAAAILSLVERGRLGLDERLADIFPEVGLAADPRHAAITVRHLLRHAGGWDRTESFDPVYDSTTLYGDAEDGPAHCDGIARDMLRHGLQFEPGSRRAYSNLGYCWLGMIVEARSGAGYESYVRNEIMEPMRLASFRLGESDVPEDELARHYAYRDGAHLPLPRGPQAEATLGRLGAAGGWVATAEDYFRFASRDLPPETAARPGFVDEDADYYGLSWRVWPGEGGATLSHAGFMPGVFSLAVRKQDGTVIVALFNGGVRDGLQAFGRLFEELRQAPLPQASLSRPGR